MPKGDNTGALVVGGTALAGLGLWLLLRRPRPKFSVGQRVALIINPTITGTVTRSFFVKSTGWQYGLFLDATGTEQCCFAESILMAI